MMRDFQENVHSADINTTEMDKTADIQSKFGIPSISDLKSELQNIFSEEPMEMWDGKTEIPDETPIKEADQDFVTLDDGTVVELPFSKENTMNVERSALSAAEETMNASDIAHRTDDNGNIYMIGGKLEPNATYKLNHAVYKTDGQGRIISCEAKPQHSPENPRDIEAQRKAGGEDRRPGDQGGHLIGRDLNGDGGGGNLVAMDSRINQSDYKRMENDLKDALDDGQEVTTKTEMTYSGDSERPDKITVTATADGKETVYKFDNNLDGTLIDEVPDNGKETVKNELDDTGGQISSIKEEYDEKGNLIETTVSITYTDEDGVNRRTKVAIDNG